MVLSRKRRLRVEQLDARVLLAIDLQNVYQPLDVNDDLRVTALDVINVINHISRLTAQDRQQTQSDDMYVDVTGDGEVTARPRP